MKKIMLFAAVVAMSLAVAMPAQAQSRKEKKAAAKAQWEMEQKQKAEEAALLHEMKMQKLREEQAASEAASKKAQADAEREEQRRLRREAQKDAMEEVMLDGDQTVYQPCYAEAIDKPGEYMAGYGISRPRKYEVDAKQEANDMALRDIASRFMGAIKHGTEYYSQSGTTPAGKDIDEANLESMTMNLVEKTINKYANQVCFKSVYNKESNKYRYYLAVHVMEGETVDALADQLDKASLLHDKQSFKKQLLKSLDAETQKKAAEQERQLQMLKDLDD